MSNAPFSSAFAFICRRLVIDASVARIHRPGGSLAKHDHAGYVTAF